MGIINERILNKYEGGLIIVKITNKGDTQFPLHWLPQDL